MGYDLHITRRQDWADPDGPEITLEDWLEYLTIDPSLEKDIEFESQVDPAVATGAKEPTMVLWNEWPSRGDGNEARLWLSHGNVMATDADVDLRRKMFVMADVLNARLQGDNGEIYNSIGEPEGRKSRRSSGGKRPWWRFW